MLRVTFANMFVVTLPSILLIHWSWAHASYHEPVAHTTTLVIT